MPGEDYYDSGGDEAAQPPQADQRDAGKEKPGEGKTGLVNSDLCPGMNVGDEMVLKIVGIHEGEYEVQYSPEPDKEAQEPQGMGEQAPAGPGAGAPADDGGMY